MPEGPSIIILKEAVAPFKGQKIATVTGNAKVDLQRMSGRRIINFKSWGKHFLICFDEFTIRIHLLMFGSYRINEVKDREPRLGFVFEDGQQLSFYTCSVKMIDGDLNEVYDWSADIMSQQWDAKSAEHKLLQQPDMLTCDALLNQDIFSGSGNIIKNEVLFRTRIHPLSKVGNLPDGVLKSLVDETRNYGFDFLEWKKAFILKQHWLAYTKKMCPRDHIPFIKQQLGKTHRRTFYCTACQVLYIDN